MISTIFKYIFFFYVDSSKAMPFIKRGSYQRVQTKGPLNPYTLADIVQVTIVIFPSRWQTYFDSPL